MEVLDPFCVARFWLRDVAVVACDLLFIELELVDVPTILIHFPLLTLFFVPGLIEATPIHLLSLFTDDRATLDRQDLTMMQAKSACVCWGLQL